MITTNNISMSYGSTTALDEKKLGVLLNKLDRLTGEIRIDKSEYLKEYTIEEDQGLHVMLRHSASANCHFARGPQAPGRKNGGY